MIPLWLAVLSGCADGDDLAISPVAAAVGGAAGQAGATSSAGKAGASGAAATGGNAGAAGAPMATAGSGGSAGSLAGAAGSGGVAGGAAGTSGAAGAAGDPAGSGGFHTAAHPPFPTMKNFGGPTLAHVALFTVSYAGYPYETDVKGFADFVASSDWLDTVGKDYGVGKGTHTGHVVLPDPPPGKISDDEIQALLAGLIENGTVPGLTKDTLVMIFFPESTTVLQGASTSCISFGAYHSSASSKLGAFAYAVEPACPGVKFGPTELAGIEVAASHEIIEAATDAQPGLKPGYLAYTGDLMSFDFIGTEVGDLCAHQPIAVAPYWVQRSWSSAAAANGENPCVPVPDGEVYCNIAPPADDIRTVKPGESTVFEITGWSLAPTDDWQIDAQQKYADFDVKLELDRTTLNNGQVAHLTVTVPADAKPDAAAGFVVRSLRGGDKGNYTMWPMAVIVPKVQ